MYKYVEASAESESKTPEENRTNSDNSNSWIGPTLIALVVLGSAIIMTLYSDIQSTVSHPLSWLETF